MITPADTPDQLTKPARPTHAAPGAPLVLVLQGGQGRDDQAAGEVAAATVQHRGLLPAHWALFGTGRGVIGTQEYQDVVRDSLTEFGQEGTGDDDVAAGAEQRPVRGQQAAVLQGGQGRDDQAAGEVAAWSSRPWPPCS